MRVTTTTCDRCGAVIKENMHVIEFRGGPHHNRAPVDLCRSCMEAVLAWLANRAPDDMGRAELTT